MNKTAQPIVKDMHAISEPTDLLFKGDDIYFGKPHKNTIAFIDRLNAQMVKNVAVFGTYGGQEKIGADIQQMLRAKGINVISEVFVSPAQSWVFMNRNRPNDEDVKKASAFANRAARKVST